MFYSSQANELRAFLRDKLGFKGTDVGDGWLIFEAPEADIGVHPIDARRLCRAPRISPSTAMTSQETVRELQSWESSLPKE